MSAQRRSGVLMPVFSLPGEWGIGCFSRQAERFIEQLAEVRAKGLYTAFLTLFANLPESDRPRLVAALLRSAVVAG